jgi:diaminohydroxyphosphoribosylaminopyrimidine deaminase/5-amino-6-(5-phosphoribosylamino)uracil reductase
VDPGAKIFHGKSPAPTIVVTAEDAPEARARRLSVSGAEVLRLPIMRGKPGRIDPRALVRTLGERGILSVLVEGGGDTHAAFLSAGLCDRLVLYVAPKAIGGTRAPSWLGGEDLARLADAHQLAWEDRPRRIGEDLVLTLVKRPS